jgi:hypothetical protein
MLSSVLFKGSCEEEVLADDGFGIKTMAMGAHDGMEMVSDAVLVGVVGCRSRK